MMNRNRDKKSRKGRNAIVHFKTEEQEGNVELILYGYAQIKDGNSEEIRQHVREIHGMSQDTPIIICNIIGL